MRSSGKSSLARTRRPLGEGCGFFFSALDGGAAESSAALSGAETASSFCLASPKSTLHAGGLLRRDRPGRGDVVPGASGVMLTRRGAHELRLFWFEEVTPGPSRSPRPSHSREGCRRRVGLPAIGCPPRRAAFRRFPPAFRLSVGDRGLARPYALSGGERGAAPHLDASSSSWSKTPRNATRLRLGDHAALVH